MKKKMYTEEHAGREKVNSNLKLNFIPTFCSLIPTFMSPWHVCQYIAW